MPEDMIAKLALTLQQYPLLTLLFIFLVAFAESLIIVGLIIPGAIFMVLFGALIALDVLAFWPTVLAAALGAILGDSLSYWLGQRYQSQLNKVWPLSRHPEIIEQAHAFLTKHGVKSIVLSRFIGLIRPVIPAIAGISNMPLKLFLTANIASAIVWAPVYLLPGILFGLSLEMASEFASKFILLLVILLLIMFVVLLGIQRIYLFSRPYFDKIVLSLTGWGERHRYMGEIPAALFEKEHAQIKGLSTVALILFGVTALLVINNHYFAHPYNPFYFNFDSFNQFIYHSLQTFRSPPLDNVMLWLNHLGSSPVFALLYLLTGALLLKKKNFYLLWYWLAAISLPLLIAPLLSNNLAQSLQQNLNLSIQALPAVVVISVVGFLVSIINSGLQYTQQKIIFYCSSVLVLFLILAQLYFATQLFSQVIISLLLASIWFNVLGIAYHRHNTAQVSSHERKGIILIIALLLSYPTWLSFTQDELYIDEKNYYVMGTNSWLESGWEILPIFRQGLKNNRNNLFNLQWVGTSSNIHLKLSQLGFESHRNSTQTLSNWFVENKDITTLPVLPHIHQGEYETLRYYRYDKKNNVLEVIRLWPSIYKLTQDSPLQPLWFGSISHVEIKKHLGMNYLVTTKENLDEINLDETVVTIQKKEIFNEETENRRSVFLLY